MNVYKTRLNMKKLFYFIITLFLLMIYSNALCKGTISDKNLYWTYIGLTESEVLEIVPDASRFTSDSLILEKYQIDNNMAYIWSEVYIDKDNHVESVVVTVTNDALKYYGLDEGISSAINKALEIFGLSHDEIDLESYNGEFFIEFYLNNSVKIRAFELIDGVFRVFAYGEAKSSTDLGNNEGNIFAQESSLSPSEMVKIGESYENGDGVEQDYSEAVKYYSMAAEQGDPEGQCNLGRSYARGNGVEKDYNEAFKWFKLSADQGYARCQYNVGVYYERGRGVTQDYSEAIKWYMLAAEQDYAGAQYNIGVLYQDGKGVEQSYLEASKWYTLAAEQGLAEAQNNLGFFYEYGLGLEKDFQKAEYWLELAAEQGVETAIKKLNDLRAFNANNTPDITPSATSTPPQTPTYSPASIPNNYSGLSTISVKDIDLTTLSFAELEALKVKVDSEFNSREETEVILLPEGDFNVGEVIQPGAYWFYNPDDCESCYSGYALYDKDGNHLGYTQRQGKDPALHVIIPENAVIIHPRGNVAFSKKEVDLSERFVYEIPEGTLLEAGYYYIGDDIPAGRYTIFPSSADGAQIYIFANEEDLRADAPKAVVGAKPNTSTPSMSIKVNDGDILAALTSFVITKNGPIEIK